MTGYTQFSDNKNIQWNSDAAGNLKPHRYPTAWESEHNDIVATGIMRQFLGELPTSIGTIQEYF